VAIENGWQSAQPMKKARKSAYQYQHRKRKALNVEISYRPLASMVMAEEKIRSLSMAFSM